MLQSQLILARKISLESKWNQLYLENGKVTTDMNYIQEEIRKCRKLLVNLDLDIARVESQSPNPTDFSYAS
jgi:uncharacterized membrane protein